MKHVRRTRTGKVTRRVSAAFCALLAAVLMAGGMGLLALSSAGATGTADNGEVCSGLDSGKIDVSGEKLSITVTAPEGKLISGYCVKAGSANQGDGPRYVTLDSPQKTVTLTYQDSEGHAKALSHYSLSYVNDSSGGGGAVSHEVTPTVVFHNPSCDEMTASWTGYVNGSADSAGDHVSFAVTAGEVAPGKDVTITATAESGYEFSGGATTKTFTHTFTAVPTGCSSQGGTEGGGTGSGGTAGTGTGGTGSGGTGAGGSVLNGTGVSAAGAGVSAPSTSGSAAGSGSVPTLVEAGLPSTPDTAEMFQATFGRGMVAAGMLLLVGSMWLGLKRSGGAHRA